VAAVVIVVVVRPAIGADHRVCPSAKP
jgi:hypothetical protein